MGGGCPPAAFALGVFPRPAHGGRGVWSKGHARRVPACPPRRLPAVLLASVNSRIVSIVLILA